MKALHLLSVLLLVACSEGGAPSPQQPPTAVAIGQPKIALAGRVTDAAQLLDPVREKQLTERLATLERRTGHQMVVVTAPTLGNEDVADFTRDLGNAWGIGRAGKDDGVILLVAPNERQVRIAVGDGLSQKLPDSLAQQIIDQHILPRFRKGDFAGGIEIGVAAIHGHLE